MINKILNISVWIILFAALLASLGFVKSESSHTSCKSIHISVSRPANHFFVYESEIEQLLLEKANFKIGSKLEDINIDVLEKIIRNNPFIANAEVYSTIDGEVHIEITQRDPIVRIINSLNESFYIDSKGEFMPLSNKYVARVPIANGFIYDQYILGSIKNLEQISTAANEETNNLWLSDKIYLLANYIYNHAFWKAQIEQIYLNEEKEIELIPKVGNHKILFGKISDLSDVEDKMNKLFTFYKEGLNRTGWNLYKTINLKYKNQVVCTKLDQI